MNKLVYIDALTEALFGTASTSRASLIRERSSDAASPLFPRAVQSFAFFAAGVGQTLV